MFSMSMIETCIVLQLLHISIRRFVVLIVFRAGAASPTIDPSSLFDPSSGEDFDRFCKKPGDECA